MNQTPAFIARLTSGRIFGPGERSRIRGLSGQGLDESTGGFDLFAGLWWPLREKNSAIPRREIAWLITKLYAVVPVRQEPCDFGGPTALPIILGREESRLLEERGRLRFRRRFDSLLCATLAELESHLQWALTVARDAAVHGRSVGLDWVQLTDHLSIWDRGDKHRRKRDIRDIWAEQYLECTNQSKGGQFYVDRNPHDSKS